MAVLSCLLMSEELRECTSNMSAVLEVVRGLTARLNALETAKPEEHSLTLGFGCWPSCMSSAAIIRTTKSKSVWEQCR